MRAINVTEGLLQTLASRRIFHGLTPQGRWKVGDRLLFHPSVQLEPYCQILEGFWLPLRMGAFSYSHSKLSSHVVIGRYCSFATGIEWMGDRHPVEWATTSPVYYGEPQLNVQRYFADVGEQRARRENKPQNMLLTIGHDVWIGNGAMIAPGVTIGHGAVVGARSLVVKDVPPYAIVGGNPARVIRYRFPEKLIERFLELAWWRFGPTVVQRCAVAEPERFLDDLEALIGAEKPPEIRPVRLDAAALESAPA